MKGPKFLIYVRPLVEVLRELGGSGTTADVIDSVIDYMKIPESEVEEPIPSGASRVRNRIQWARMYLVNADLMDSSERGVWKLTEKGYEASLSDEKIYELFKKVHKTFQSPKKNKNGPLAEENEEQLVEDVAHGEALLDILKNLSPEGFEKICKRLLTEVGIHDVQVTGKTGDMGIDGTGVIKVNEVVGFNVIFQCKKFKDAVAPHHVRDFRGTMQGRAEKGIFITTGRFTAEAKKEAVRDGVPPIELIDGERLVSLFEKYQLGLKPRVVYDIVPDFFDKYK
jgi:restriction system protein